MTQPKGSPRALNETLQVNTMNIKPIAGPDKVFFGTNKDTKERIYISKPTFDCDWYWSFGYLGNRNCHYHLDGYAKQDNFIAKDSDGKYHSLTVVRNICMHDALLADYELSDRIKANLWKFCELALTIYTLKEAAGIYHIGGSHQTTNPCKDLLKDDAKYKELVETTLPVLLQTFWDLVAGKEGE